MTGGHVALRHPVGIDVEAEERHSVGLDAEDRNAEADDCDGKADLCHLHRCQPRRTEGDRVGSRWHRKHERKGADQGWGKCQVDGVQLQTLRELQNDRDNDGGSGDVGSDLSEPTGQEAQDQQD